MLVWGSVPSWRPCSQTARCTRPTPTCLRRYPSRWRLTIPTADLVLEITPRLAAQELIVGTRYWEGAVRAQGVAGGRPV